MIFEYDPLKAYSNPLKHDQVSFDEAKSVFEDANAFYLPDEKHSTIHEVREIVIGYSFYERRILVVFTERTQKTDPCPRIRIISARIYTGDM